MKIQKFLECIEHKLLNYPDVDFPTLKLFLDKFCKCLSKTEYQRNHLIIAMIYDATTKQITIDSFVQAQTDAELETEFNKLAKEGKDKL